MAKFFSLRAHLRDDAKLDLARKVARRRQQAGDQYGRVPASRGFGDFGITAQHRSEAAGWSWELCATTLLEETRPVSVSRVTVPECHCAAAAAIAQLRVGL